jgi:membrane-associated phospholipid phosphatase
MAETSGKPIQNAQDSAQRAAKGEVTSTPARRYRTYLFMIGLIAIVGAFTTLTILVKTTPSFPIDLAITRAIQSITWPPFATLMDLVSWPGFPPQSFILSLLVILIVYALGFHWEAVAALFAGFFTALVNVIVKDYIRRPRPGIDLVHVFKVLNSYSFPSGHVMYYVGFFGFLWFLAYALLKRSWLRTLILIVLGLLIALVGVSRVYLGQHWPSDVLGAYLLGSLCLVVAILFYRWGKKRFFVRQPVAAEKPKATNTSM